MPDIWNVTYDTRLSIHDLSALGLIDSGESDL